MLIVTQGIVDGVRKGGTLDGLAPDREAWLVAQGVCRRPGEAPEAPTPKRPTKAELQAKCREYGISEKGTVADLQARIEEFEAADREEPEEPEDGDEPPALIPEVPR